MNRAIFSVVSSANRLNTSYSLRASSADVGSSDLFGVKGAHVIERKIAKNLYDKILLPFDDEQGSRLEDFIESAKETISADTFYV